MPLETADNKVKEICAILRTETLEPAQAQAKLILDEAAKEADEIVRNAREEAARIREENKVQLAKDLNVHEGSIQLSIRQGLSALRQAIEKIFSADLDVKIEKAMGKDEAVAEAVRVLFGLIAKEGPNVNLNVLLPKHVNIEAICAQLSSDFAEMVKKSAIQMDDIKGGAEIKLKEKRVSIELTDAAVKELLAAYVIPELRAKIFCEG